MNVGTLLKVSSLKKSFGGVHALKDISFDLRDGEILGLIGPNGSGKSTLVNIIAGLYKPDGGEVTLAGVNVTGLEPAIMARRGVARTFQSSRPFLNLTVLENVLIAALLHETTTAAAEALAIQCIEVAGLRDMTHVKSSALPIEKRRRLDLCRTLALKPRIIMLDECLAGLNPREMEEGLDLIRTLNRRDIAIIFIEHVMKAVCSLCHRLVVLNQGELLVEGGPDDVMKDPRVIAAYLGDKYIHAGH